MSCLRGFSSAERSPNEEKYYANHRSVSSTATSVVEFLKPKCLRKEKKKDMEMQQKEKQEDHQQLTSTVKEVLTLEEWFMASPGTGDYCFWTKGGEYCVFKHYLSKKIHPSLAAGDSADFTSKPRAKDSTSNTVSLETLLKMEEIDTEEKGVISAISRSQSGKEKKRVSFKLPQESDIIIFQCSPEVDAEDIDDS